jgi:UDP-N-acetylmuramate--alanine ligase
VTPAHFAGRRLHFVGIGGCGMSSVALAARALGAEVTGSDHLDGPYLDRLRAAGIGVTIGHDATLVPDGSELIVTPVIPLDNPERAQAKARGLREVTRGELLAEIAALRRTIAVAGTHGKTTTAAMIVHVLRYSGWKVDYILGADWLGSGTNGEWDGQGWLVVETDEADLSILHLQPEVGVLTNVDHDHVETFATLGEVEMMFRNWLACCGKAVTADGVECQLSPVGSSFVWRGQQISVPLLGAHNAQNAATALEVCAALGIAPPQAASAMASFPGVARRLEFAGHTRTGAAVYDDYAHHPTAVAAGLAALRTLTPETLVAVIRPWGPGRLAAMAGSFGAALVEADLVVVLEIASKAWKTAQQGPVTSALLVEAARFARPGRSVERCNDPDTIELLLSGRLGPGSVCVAMCCGDVVERLTSSDRATRSTPRHSSSSCHRSSS